MRDRRRLLVAATAVAVLLIACAPSTPTAAPLTPPPAATTSPTTTPTAAPPTEPAMSLAPPTIPAVTSPPALAACSIADLKASHGFVEGDADIRQTEVVLVSAVACSVDAIPGMQLRDGDGQVVAEHAAGPEAVAIDLVSGVAYTAEVQVRNWCAGGTAYPLTLEVLLGEDALAVTGSSFPEEGDLPPCTAGGEPVLDASAWVATP